MNSISTYTTPAREIPVIANYDVIVCGGGPAGCAAAITAARNGAKTILLEKYGYLGGATVSMLVVPILSTNGVDLQGIWQEWIRELHARNGVTKFSRHKAVPYIITGSVDPEQVKITWEAMVKSSNADILLHAHFSEAIIEDSAICGIVLETCAGRCVIYGKRVIDTTGDGMVCASAGVPWEQGDEIGRKWAMALSKIFILGNITNEQAEGRIVANRYAERMAVGKRLLKKDPLNPWDLSTAEIEAREDISKLLTEIRKDSLRKNAYLVETSNHVGIRSSRRIRGRDVVTAEQAWNFVKNPNGIAKSSWDIDIWPAESDQGPPVPRSEDEYIKRIEKMKEGDYFDIPFGCLVADRIDNLLMAGRCISAEHGAQASLRIQQTCQATGQASGLAAAMSISENIQPANLDVNRLQKQLAEVRAESEVGVNNKRSPEEWNKALFT